MTKFVKWKFKNNTLKNEKRELVALFNKKNYYDNKPTIQFNEDLYITNLGGFFVQTNSMVGSKEALYSTSFLFRTFEIKILNFINKTQQFAVLKPASFFSAIYELKIDNCVYIIEKEAIFHGIIKWEVITIISGENKAENLSAIVFCTHLLNCNKD